MTQAELGGDRLSESYISLIESGRRTPASEAVEFLAERLGTTAAALTGQAALPDAANAELLIRRGEWETNSGRPEAARKHLAEGIVSSEQLGLPLLVVRGRIGMARANETEGNLREAISLWEGLLAESESDSRNIPLATVTVALSRCCRELGDLDRAIEVAERYWQAIDRKDLAVAEDAVVVGATLLSAYLELGDTERSREMEADLIELAEQVNTPMATGAAYWNAALAAEADGRIADALTLAERAQVSMSQTEDVRNKARLQVVLGGLHLRTKPPDTLEARRLLSAADPVLQQFGSTIDVGYCRTELARAYLHDLDFELARVLAQSTIDDLERHGESPIELARTLMVMAAANSGLGNASAGRKHAQRAADLLEHAGANRQAASRWTELAELYVELGDSAAAIEAFRKATDLLGAKKTAAGPVTHSAQRQPKQRRPKAV